MYFEKEGIDTGKVSGEMLTAVFASLAQAESESISKNMRWSYQKRMQMGNIHPASIPFGYVLEDGKITIEPEEADVVRKIYDMYLSGSGRVTIAQNLNRRGYLIVSISRGIAALYFIYSLMRDIPEIQYGRKLTRQMYFLVSTREITVKSRNTTRKTRILQ